MFFHPGPVRSYADARQTDTELFQRYFRGMLDEGIYLAPSAFEAGFLSTRHTEEMVDQTVEAAGRVLGRIS